MTQVVNKNTFAATYKDDYADSDNYYRILFNSGKKLQARELTQMQTIIQKQIERFGNNIFQDNTLIKEGTAGIDNGYEYIKLDISTYPVATPQNLVGAVYTGQTSAVQFTVNKVVEATGSDPLTLYGKYTNTKNATSVDSTTIPRANSGEVMTSPSQVNIQLEASATSRGVASRFMAGAAIYYSKGFFVITEDQEIILSKYSTNPTVEVGFKRIEETVSSDDDTGLYDNQGTEPNITAPGADRYRIKLTLIDKSQLAAGEDFVFRAYVDKGVITSSANIVNSYNVPAQHVASRIFENSGDYLVKPFKLEYQDDSSNDFILASITDGVAVVQGYRSTRFTSKPTIRVAKAQETFTLEDQLVATPYGNYFIADSSGPAFSGLTPRIQTSTGYDQQIIKDAGAGFSGTQIGTCYIRHIERQGDGSVHYYIFDLKLNDGKAINDINSIGTSSTSYVQINNNSRTNGPFQTSGQRNDLIYPLPTPRPADVDNADLTVQRQIEFSAAGTSQTLNLSGTETFTDTNTWLITDQNGNVDSLNNPAATFITLSNGNQTATIAGLNNGEDTRATVYVRKPNVSARTKTVTTINEIKYIDSDPITGLNYIDLQRADIIGLTHIEDPTDSSQSYASLFDLDNGRKDNYYANGKLLYLADSAPPAMRQAGGGDGVRVRYTHFQHSGGNSFFDKTSYDGQVDYEDIPVHTYRNGTQIRLTDALDFRPTADNQGGFETSNGGSINELPKPSGVTDLNVSYYIPRADKLTIDKNGQLNYIKGTSSYKPTPPETPPGEMPLFEVYLGANTLNSDDLTIRRIEHKRYTMSQIGLLEKRLARLEEITTLSLLEQKADNFQVFDGAGNNRLRAGFVVDNFTSHAQTDFRNIDHRAAIDLNSGVVYPRKVERTLDLLYDSDINNAITKDFILEGGMIVPTYEEEDYMENQYASGAFQLNAFQVNTYQGTIDMVPSSDTWYETIYASKKSVTFNGSSIIDDNSFKWNDWEFNWKGKSLEELQVGDIINKIESSSGRKSTASFNVVENIQIQETYDKNILVREDSIPRMRSKLIRFRATGLQANSKLYAFFNDVPVDNWVRTEDFSSIDFKTEFNNDVEYGNTQYKATQHPDGKSQLTSDDNGVCEGSFFLPSTPTENFLCGAGKFELRNVSGLGNQDYSSRAVANYVAAGTLQTFERHYTSTRIVHIEGDNEIYTSPIIKKSSSGTNSLNDDNWSQSSNTGAQRPGDLNNNNNKSIPITANICYAASNLDEVLGDNINIVPPVSSTSTLTKNEQEIYQRVIGWLTD